MLMEDPPHPPGQIVQQECPEALGLGMTDGTKARGWSRNALSKLVNERRDADPAIDETFARSPQAAPLPPCGSARTAPSDRVRPKPHPAYSLVNARPIHPALPTNRAAPGC